MLLPVSMLYSRVGMPVSASMEVLPRLKTCPVVISSPAAFIVVRTGSMSS